MSEVALFFEKMQKVFKNKAQRCSTPLTQVKNSIRLKKIFIKIEIEKILSITNWPILYDNQLESLEIGNID